MSLLSLFFLAAFIAEHGIIYYEVDLWSVGPSCLSCVLSHLLVHLKPTHW